MRGVVATAAVIRVLIVVENMVLVDVLFVVDGHSVPGHEKGLVE
jgi:hypothetical protein